MSFPARHLAFMAVTVASSSVRAEPVHPSTLADLMSRPIVSAETTYTMGNVFADHIADWTARFAVEVPVRNDVILHAEAAAVRASSENEGDTFTHSTLGNPTLLVRYWRPHAVWQIDLAVTSGITAAIVDEPAGSHATSYEAPRRPYEFASISAVPVMVDARYLDQRTALQAEVGAYFVSDHGPQLDSLHAALGAMHDYGGLYAAIELHALLVSAASQSPPNTEVMRRSYFGVDAGIGFPCGPGTARLGVWKPFGYDRNDAAEDILGFGVGYSSRL